jgi:uncharacterized protein YdiU (UPF0061 family)
MFVELFSLGRLPRRAMWVGSGEHYSFGNQVEAARRNWETLVRSLEPPLDNTTAATAARHAFADEANKATANMWAAKLGFCWTEAIYRGDWTDDDMCLPEELATASKLWADASALLDADVDYTLFWRRLAAAKRSGAHALEALAPAFYVPPSPAKARLWRDWLARWRRADPNVHAMNSVNPLFVPREWMLVEACESAYKAPTIVEPPRCRVST